MEEKNEDQITKEEHDKIVDSLYSEIKRKDKIIKDLKEENMIIMRTAIRGSQELLRWKEIAAKDEKNKLNKIIGYKPQK